MSEITARLLFCWGDEIEESSLGDLAHPAVLWCVDAVPDGALCGDRPLFLYGTGHPGGKRHPWEPNLQRIGPGRHHRVPS